MHFIHEIMCLEPLLWFYDPVTGQNSTESWIIIILFLSVKAVNYWKIVRSNRVAAWTSNIITKTHKKFCPFSIYWTGKSYFVLTVDKGLYDENLFECSKSLRFPINWFVVANIVVVATSLHIVFIDIKWSIQLKRGYYSDITLCKALD